MIIDPEFPKLIRDKTRKSNSDHWYGDYRCQCGKIFESRMDNIHSGKLCSDCRRIHHSDQIRTHGESKSRLHAVWRSMRSRVGPSAYGKNYKNYHLNGIRVCDDWDDYLKFKEWAMSHGYRKGLFIDRRNYGGDYCPDNCRWIDSVESSRNRKSVLPIDQVIEIKKMISSGLSAKEIASWFKISDDRVRSIRRGFTFNNI